MAGQQADDPIDPRFALAQQYLKKVASDLAEKEAAQPRSQRARTPTNRGAPKAFSFSIAPPTFVHLLLAAIVLTFAGLTVLACYHMMRANFTAGRVIALPAGVITFATLSYVSVIFLGIIETTSLGHTNVDSLQGDWREWFWTLPGTLGMLAVAAFVGWLLSVVLSANVWLLIALCALLLYPILQLSSLETGSPLQPLSFDVLQSIVKHPAGWFVFYVISFAVANLLWLAARLAWHDPPYITVVIMGPIVTVALFFYAWLLGQLAHLISKEDES